MMIIINTITYPFYCGLDNDQQRSGRGAINIGKKATKIYIE